MKILFFDDNPDRHITFRETTGLVFFCAFNIKQAIELLDSESPFDLVSLDHDMDGKAYTPSDEKSGFAVAQHIAQMPKEKQPKFAIVHTWSEAGGMNMVRELTCARVRCQWAMFNYAPFWKLVDDAKSAK